jgi:hypothetical protein
MKMELNVFAVSPSNKDGDRAMSAKDDRERLENNIANYRAPEPERPKPVPPRCPKCGQQPRFITSMLHPSAGRTFHMFECQCSGKSWTSEKS